MRWHLLDAITELIPGRSAAGIATTALPDQLFEDHFPTFPITPGVLLVEMWAQLGGRLLQATVWEQRRLWTFPVLTMIHDVKFRAFVPPNAPLRVETELAELRPESALVKGRLLLAGKRCANGSLVLAFDPHGQPYFGDRERLEDFGRGEFARLGSPWCPPPYERPGPPV